jgi:hypothetical protein
MSRQVIQIGTTDNDGTGDPLRSAYNKCNGNFAELYSAVVQSSGSVVTTIIDWGSGNYFYKKLTAHTTFVFANGSDARNITVAVENTNGNFAVTFPTAKWQNGTAPTQTVGPKVDVYSFVKMNGTIYGAALQNMS